MVRRRTATLSVTAVALVLATPLITSCGAQHPGSAAVIGGRSITVAELQSQVKQVRAAQAKNGHGDQAVAASSNLDRSTLTSLVFNRVLDRAARDAHVTVGRNEVQDLENASAQQAGSVQALHAGLLQQYSVAPSQIDAFFLAQVQAQAIARSLGVDLSAQTGQMAVTKLLTKASHELRVDVNPRYGTWNAQTLTLGTAPEPWLKSNTQPAPAPPVQQG